MSVDQKKEDPKKSSDKETIKKQQETATTRQKEEETLKKKTESTIKEAQKHEEPIRPPTGQSEYGTAVDDPEEKVGSPAPQIRRAGKPTEEDVGTIQDPPEVHKAIPTKTPQQRAREQSDQHHTMMDKANKIKLKSPKTPLETPKAGIEDSSIPGARVGDPIEVPAEPLIGDKVHNLLQDGIRLEVQSHDKSNSIPIHENLRTGNIIRKRKVSLLFPGINPDVAQRSLEITITEHPFGQQKTYKVGEVFPPDVSNKEVLLPLNSKIHVELFHVDKNGYFSHPYILDFYTMVINNPEFSRPLQASPIGYELMEEVNTYE